jgi:DNA topoisomerase-3
MLDLGVKTGQTAGLSGAAAMARRNMVTDAMLKSMGGNCINIGVVLERYADFCGQLRRDAEPRLKELAAGQTPAMKRFADSLARQKGIKLPPGYTTTISICRAFLNQHAPKKADAETVPVSLAQMVYAKKIAQGKRIVIPDEAKANSAAMSAWIDSNRWTKRRERGRKAVYKPAGSIAPQSTARTKRPRKRKADTNPASPTTAQPNSVTGTPLRIPYGNKEVALKLGARYGSAGWYAPPGIDLAAFGERGWL